MITMNMSDLRSTIESYEESLTSTLSAITTIKGNIDLFQEKLSQLSKIERIDLSIIKKPLTHNIEVEGADTRKEVDNAVAAGTAPAAQVAPAAAVAPNIFIREPDEKRFCWKKIIPDLLLKNGDMTTGQIIKAASHSGIIDATDKKQVTCLRSGLKSLDKKFIKRIENSYRSPWTLA